MRWFLYLSFWLKPEFISCTRRNHLLNSRDNLLNTRNNLLNTRHYLQNARNYLITTEGKKHVPSNATHSSAKQATHIPGTTGVRQVPTGGTGNGGGRTMESGIGRFPSLTGTTQSTSSPRPIATNDNHITHQPLVSHFLPRRHACLRGFPAIFAGRRAGQR